MGLIRGVTPVSLEFPALGTLVADRLRDLSLIRGKLCATLEYGILSWVGTGFVMMDSAEKQKLIIGKLDAARRQLNTAIREWFCGGDPVVIHTLACAAYEIIHALSLQRNPNRRDLLFDNDNIKSEYQKDWRDILRKPANFFKHADRDGDSVIEFSPQQSHGFILFSILGVQLCGERINTIESAWLMWLQIKNPKYLTEKGRKYFADNIPIESLEHARSLSREDFFEFFCTASQIIAAGETMPKRSIPRRVHRLDISG